MNQQTLFHADLYPDLSCVNGLNKEFFMKKYMVSAPTVDRGAISHLFNNLDTILANRTLILNTPEYYNVQIPGCSVSGLYIGAHKLMLGDLLVLWQDTDWHTDNMYVYAIIGSPLSGSNSCNVWDSARKRITSVHFPSFGKLAFPALNYIQHGTFTATRDNSGIKFITGKMPRRERSDIDIFALVSRLAMLREH